MKNLLLFALLILLSGDLMSQEEDRLLRFPTIHDDQVVFTYAGDLYSASLDNQVARKLTSHNGFEMFAKFSQDGEWIAFTGQYDGNTEVYVMPSDGGVPTRLTYTATLSRDNIWDRMGPNNIVMGWTPDGNSIVFRSRMHSFNSFKGALYTVSKKGGMPEKLPLITGGFCSFSPDGKSLAFSKIFREFRTWKYYRGGMADDVRILNIESGTSERLFTNPSQDIFPMWHNDKIYFLSDRDRTMNLFVYDLNDKSTTKVTSFDLYDIKFPSIGNNAVVFENGGYLYTHNLSSGETEKLNIQILDDQSIGRDFLADSYKNIRGWDISSDGSRAVFSARGDIYTVPAENGVTRNINKSSGIHERSPVWSPNGTTIAYISEKDQDQNGKQQYG